jgi:hypothetical protein
MQHRHAPGVGHSPLGESDPGFRRARNKVLIVRATPQRRFV